MLINYHGGGERPWRTSQAMSYIRQFPLDTTGRIPSATPTGILLHTSMTRNTTPVGKSERFSRNMLIPLEQYDTIKRNHTNCFHRFRTASGLTAPLH
jgi:hypothetical protein